MPAKSYTDCIKSLREAQEAESDNRDMVREADHFLNKRDGQWEPQIISTWSNRPRYSFDECNPIVDDIMGEMETMDFDIRVNPASGGASKETANYFEGIIRNIENISNARFTYNAAARLMVGTGFNAWRVVQAYRDDDSFNQDLMIRPLASVEDSLWFDPGAVMQTMEDAEYCYMLTSLTKADYKERWPKGSCASVGNDLKSNTYTHKKKHEVVIGEYLYRKRMERELLLLSNGMVVENNEDFAMIKNELDKAGIIVVDTRKREYHVVYQKIFDGDDFITDAKETVFEYLPIIPVYGNFRISESKVIYWGITEKVMDAQRVINYAESRKIEEGALAPKGKMWMSKEQATSVDVIATLRTLNTNNDPVQFYDFKADQPAPAYVGAPQSNPGLVETTQSAKDFIQRTSGTFDEARGQAPAQRSGIAIDKLQNKSDNPKRKWFTSVEVALTHTARILIKAIPKVYDTQQEMQMINPDGTTDSVVIKQKVMDEESGKMIEVNDLSKGNYDVVVSAGPAFHSRQQETVAAINEIATIDPSIMQMGSDVLLNNIPSPGIDVIAERKRLQMLQQGLIPDSQLTDEEKKIVEAQRQQPPPEDPMLVAAKAEQARVEGENKEREMKLQMEQMKLDQKTQELQMKGQIEQMKLQIGQQKQYTENLKAISEQVQVQANSLKLIREAIGADGVVDPAAIAAFRAQAGELLETVSKQ